MNLYDCIQNYNQEEYCAFVNGTCFSVDPLQNRCDQFNQVSLAYCLEFPECVYDKANSRCLNFRVSEFYESK